MLALWLLTPIAAPVVMAVVLAAGVEIDPDKGIIGVLLFAATIAVTAYGVRRSAKSDATAAGTASVIAATGDTANAINALQILVREQREELKMCRNERHAAQLKATILADAAEEARDLEETTRKAAKKRTPKGRTE